MNAKARFANDGNTFVMIIQNNEYLEMLSNLLQISIDNYNYFEWNAMIDPSLREKLENQRPFNRNLFLFAHDVIASAFRFVLCPRQSITYTQFDFTDYYLEAWRAFYRTENEYLSKNRISHLSILNAAAYHKSDKGRIASNDLVGFLFDRYPFLDRSYFMDLCYEAEKG